MFLVFVKESRGCSTHFEHPRTTQPARRVAMAARVMLEQKSDVQFTGTHREIHKLR